ncbi:hypothetical protein VP01_1975g3 [Puccinia sorghi]|uniref:Uncharacterized protein n=1 Tax=Puccinia sorghi TaxID=27349 RepID=A0A0L6VDK9_9BASI|nr:hypothetical protein VP01_1976g1 [Puccinia sorghi]KNZ58210.1 hypothetical protein VP01_1975g3 [Puccinia sorghi]
MAPPPNVVVIMNDGGKEIGGSNHYCIICRVPTPRNPPEFAQFNPTGMYVTFLLQTGQATEPASRVTRGPSGIGE